VITINNNFFRKDSLHILIIFIPFFEFYSANFFEFEKHSFFYFCFFSIILIFLTFFFIKIINFIFKKNLTLTISIFFFLIFKYLLIKNIFSNFAFTKNIDGELSLLFIFMLSFLVSKFANRINYNLVEKFIIFYLLLHLIILFPKIIYINKNDFLRINKSELVNNQDFNNIKNTKNIYYVVLDGMTSIESFEEFYDFKLSDFKTFINKENLFYSEGHTAYPNTMYNFTSLLNLDYIVDEKSDPLINRSLMYPYSMRENLINNYNLLKFLKKIDFNLKWEGSAHPGNCYNYNIDICINKKKASKIQLIRNNFYIIDSFLSLTPIFSITTRLNIYNPYNKLYDIHKLHDSIGNLMNNLKSLDLEKKNYFFLIHHMSPHNPFVFKKDCSKREINSLLNDRDLEGFKESYLCALKKIEELYFFVQKYDPEAILVFQGDHGWNFNHDNRNSINIEFYNPNTFNLIVAPKKCTKDISKEYLNMINTARIVLGCSINKKIKMVPTKRFFTYPTNDKNYGKVFLIK
tara:strand:- start:1626 stop:3179 length:1554 start_codon:yes stop_codon:yes gene_type:complete